MGAQVLIVERCAVDRGLGLGRVGDRIAGNGIDRESLEGPPKVRVVGVAALGVLQDPLGDGEPCVGELLSGELRREEKEEVDVPAGP